MNQIGDAKLLVAARRALLDALQALEPHRDALVLVGAQAIYLHTGRAQVALAESTRDSDIAIHTGRLQDDPLLEEAMRGAGFSHHPTAPQPGSWLSSDGIPVDLMVPERLAGKGSRRSGRIPPHSDRATRRTKGLEAAVVDCSPMWIAALEASDDRSFELNVAGPAALLVAKLHKIHERRNAPGRLIDKDAHDIYRLLVATNSQAMADSMRALKTNELSGEVTNEAITYLTELFASGPNAVGSIMAGRAETLVGDPEQVSASVSLLAQDVITLV